MEIELDLPNYLYDKPDGYYADDIIKNRDEIIDELKKEHVYIHFGDFSDFDEDEDHIFFFCEDEEELKNLDREDFKILNYKLVGLIGE